MRSRFQTQRFAEIQPPYKRPLDYRAYSKQIMHGEFSVEGIIIDAPTRSRTDIPRAITHSRQSGQARLPNIGAGSRRIF